MFFDLSSGNKIREFNEHEKAINSVIINSDSKYFISGFIAVCLVTMFALSSVFGNSPVTCITLKAMGNSPSSATGENRKMSIYRQK